MNGENGGRREEKLHCAKTSSSSYLYVNTTVKIYRTTRLCRGRPTQQVGQKVVFLGGLGGVVVIDAAIGAHGRGSRLAHYFTVAATLDKSLTSHCL